MGFRRLGLRDQGLGVRRSGFQHLAGGALVFTISGLGFRG